MPRGEQVNEVALELVRVLIFVHENKLESALVSFAHFCVLLQQFQPEHEQIVKVHHAGGALAFGVATLHLPELWRERTEIVVALFENSRDRLLRVDGQRKNVGDHIGLGKARCFEVDLRLVKTVGNQVLRVFAIQNRETPWITEQISVPAQNAVADRVKRAAPER